MMPSIEDLRLDVARPFALNLTRILRYNYESILGTINNLPTIIHPGIYFEYLPFLSAVL
jgi:hypothetical protein